MPKEEIHILEVKITQNDTHTHWNQSKEQEWEPKKIGHPKKAESPKIKHTRVYNQSSKNEKEQNPQN